MPPDGSTAGPGTKTAAGAETFGTETGIMGGAETSTAGAGEAGAEPWESLWARATNDSSSGVGGGEPVGPGAGFGLGIGGCMTSVESAAVFDAATGISVRSFRDPQNGQKRFEAGQGWPHFGQ
jgi:hypothetical protein